tara:strand:- start:58596 stop:59528 length:933 start_codon:yes stop_codon:yes gene_type:complete
MDNNPLVSILVNYWESIDYLDECIESIQNQTYKNWEIIFIDNNSKKSPKKILNKIKKNKLIYHKLKNYKPLGQARNVGLKKCSGELIAFIDTDDLWHRNKLYLQVNQFIKDKNIGMVICDSKIIINNKIIKRKTDLFYEKKSPVENLIHNNFIVMSSAIIKKDLIEENQITFQNNFEVLEDTLFFFQILCKSKLKYIKKFLCSWRYRKNSHTFKNTEKLYYEKLFFKEKYLLNKEYENVISKNAILNYDINLKILEATTHIYKNNLIDCRNTLKPYIKKSCKLVLIYLMSFVPKKTLFFLYRNIFKRPLI